MSWSFGSLFELPDDPDDRLLTKNLFLTFLAVIAMGVLSLGFLAMSVKWLMGRVLLTAAAAAGVGGLLGFLFGIPRAGDAPADSDADGGEEGKPAGPRTLRPNTNLERVSDWLTKMLIGVGLAEAREIAGGLKRVSQWLAPAFGGSAPLVAVCLVTFAIWGFFAAYLAFRMFFTVAFSRSDSVAMDSHRAAQKASELERQGQAAREKGQVEKERALRGQAARSYQDAFTLLPSTASAAQRQRVAEGTVMNALYIDPPEGYRAAIEAANSYLHDPDNAQTGYIYACLAAAYGQQYRFEQAQHAPNDRLADIENDAFDTAQKAIGLDRSMKDFLRRLWNPSDQNALDDDLQALHPDGGAAGRPWKQLLGSS